MSVGKIVKTEFFVYLNKELYKIAHSWEEFKTVEREIFTKYSGYSWIHGSSDRFSVHVNDKTKDVITYWYRMRETTNLKDSQGNTVCVHDELIDNISKYKCWLLCLDDELYVRFDNWHIPNIDDIRDLSNFTITKRYSIF
nr:MAG TPA: hypothetical protein [Crassvirales sp.]